MVYEVEFPPSAARWRKPSRLDIVDGDTSYLQRALRRAGVRGYQPETTAALLAIWEHQEGRSTFLDIGANGGLYSALCAKAFPESTVVAFEPMPAIAEQVRAIAASNALDIRVEEVAVSDHEGVGRFYVSAKSDASSSLTEGFRTAKEVLEVPLITVDGFVDSTGLRPTVLKIDVEQHEPQVLAGAVETLSRFRPIVVIEILRDDETVVEAVAEQLERAGYSRRHLVPRIMHPDQEDPAHRDWLCWPDGPAPRRFERRLLRWERAVSRCAPGSELEQP
jgi:FkbM family methyltransferase